MTNPNDPAFSDRVLQKGRTFEEYGQVPLGLTKREYFAVMAMHNRVIYYSPMDPSIHNDLYRNENEIAHWAIKQADALIAELNKEVKP